MKAAIKRFLIFTAAVLAFLAARYVGEEWFYLPETVSAPFGFFVMGLIMKPLIAPDMKMTRWMVVPLAGMAISMVLLTAPRWYARWTEPTLPEFMPTEEDFIGPVIYSAEGWSRGRTGARKSPRACGTYRPGDDVRPGKLCAEEALEAGEAFYLFNYPQGIDTFIAEAIASDGLNVARRFHYSLDMFMSRRGPRSSLQQTWCPEPRFLDGPGLSGLNLQCGPFPTPSEFRDDIAVGKDCGRHVIRYGIRDTHASGLDCAIDALARAEAFHYRFETNWGGDFGIVDGALSWLPEFEVAPTLAYYVNDNSTEPDWHIVRRICPSPRFRLVESMSGDLRRQGGNSLEIDCGEASPSPR